MSQELNGLIHIGKLAKEAGTTTRTVRFYEEIGLIKPECRSQGGFRCYCRDQIVRLRMILNLKEMEFDLEQIKAILKKQDAHDTGGELAHAVLEDLNSQLEEVNTQIAHYQQVRDKLTHNIASICECLPCNKRIEERLCDTCHTLDKTEYKSVPFFHVQPPNGGSNTQKQAQKQA